MTWKQYDAIRELLADMWAWESANRNTDLGPRGQALIKSAEKVGDLVDQVAECDLTDEEEV